MQQPLATTLPEPIQGDDRLPVLLQHRRGVAHKGLNILLHFQERQLLLPASDLLPDEAQLVLGLCRGQGQVGALNCCPGAARLGQVSLGQQGVGEDGKERGGFGQGWHQHDSTWGLGDSQHCKQWGGSRGGLQAGMG